MSLHIDKLPIRKTKTNISDLPQTDKWLDLHAESIEQYQSFRLTIAADKLKQQNLPVQRWRLLRVSGIRKESLTPILDQKIIELEAS